MHSKTQALRFRLEQISNSSLEVRSWNLPSDLLSTSSSMGEFLKMVRAVFIGSVSTPMSFRRPFKLIMGWLHSRIVSWLDAGGLQIRPFFFVAHEVMGGQRRTK